MATAYASDLATLFFGSYRRQVLGLLLLHADESFHLREIARITHTQPGTLRRELGLLTDAGVLEREQVGNQLRYRANPACPIFDELRGILRKTAGVADVLREALAPLGGRIEVAFVYGSVARGAERRASDVDVLVVGDVEFEEIVRALHPCEEQLRRPVNAHVYSSSEFKRKAQGRNSFLSRVLAAPRLLLVGSDDDFGKPGEDRQAQGTQGDARRGRKTP